jgi:hypothetical protein
MNHLTADELMLARLGGIVEPIEIRDPDGKLMGHYTPFVPPELAALYDKARKLFDPVEIERRLAESNGPGRTTAEVLERLRSSEKQG